MNEMGKLRQVRDLMATLRQAGLSDEAGAPSAAAPSMTGRRRAPPRPGDRRGAGRLARAHRARTRTAFTTTPSSR